MMGIYPEVLAPHSISVQRTGATSESLHWTGGIVPYKWSRHYPYSGSHKAIILQAMKKMENVSCIRFVESNRSDEEYFILLVPGFLNDCKSNVGRQKGGQRLFLSAGCISIGTAQHELMHALGFLHEQARHDRDDYVEIVKGNIQRGMEQNFRKFPHEITTSFEEEYDFGSLMHYTRFAFAKRDKEDPTKPVGPTIIPKPQYKGKTLGREDGLSEADIRKLNRMYGCRTETTSTPATCVSSSTSTKQYRSTAAPSSTSTFRPLEGRTSLTSRFMLPPKLQVPSVREWKLGESFAVGDEVSFRGKIYTVLQAHTADAANWTPDQVPALFAEIPLDLVTRNVYSPGRPASLLLDLSENNKSARKWQRGARFFLGERVSHAGKMYKVLQPHTANSANWTPDQVPALFLRI
ncbi:putative Zinc metalloproteinase nas-7 [Hypsibius exemplaris]|uniref:Metalloendopeptidase n=1 Tax=Hypsibius exemplaris TaxID=2072580 RepID=A0A1W0X660_HYPEX|nr:putative Zinc metalloproteinase nas-7 [Hypsibius exemplaris]